MRNRLNMSMTFTQHDFENRVFLKTYTLHYIYPILIFSNFFLQFPYNLIKIIVYIMISSKSE